MRALAIAAVWLLASTAEAQSIEPSHFTYTGALHVEGAMVADAHQVPLRGVRFVDATHIDVSLQHPGLRMEARGERSGLQYYMHAWTQAHAVGFTVYIAPETRVDVAEGTTAARVVFTHSQLGEVRLGRAQALPAWLQGHIEEEARLYTHCEATTLYARASEESASMPLEAGQTLYTQPVRGGWQETWARIETHWVRGFAREVHCTSEDIGGLGLSGSGSSGFSEAPPHVLLPVGLRLVSPAHPSRVVLRVTAPVDATSWSAGWTSANNEPALTIAFPCSAWRGRLTIAASQLVPEGAPPRTR